MKLILPIFLLLLVAAAAGATGVVNPTNGHTYFLTSTEMSWTNAEAEGISLGGHLVTINNSDENQWIMSTFTGGAPYWIGIHQLPNSTEPAGGFVWSSGESVSYTNWMQGEPSNMNGNEDYGMLVSAWSGKWNDAPNAPLDGMKYGIVEVVPEPSSILALSCGLLVIFKRRNSVR